MFANKSGDVIVPVKLDAPGAAKLFASATRDNASGETILKVVNGAEAPAEVKVDLAGARKVAAKAVAFTLAGGSQQDENSFAEPRKVSPQESKIKISSPQFSYTFPANSLTVLRLKISK